MSHVPSPFPTFVRYHGTPTLPVPLRVPPLLFPPDGISEREAELEGAENGDVEQVCAKEGTDQSIGMSLSERAGRKRLDEGKARGKLTGNARRWGGR